MSENEPQRNLEQEAKDFLDKMAKTPGAQVEFPENDPSLMQAILLEADKRKGQRPQN